jgi:hypothetical protein
MMIARGEYCLFIDADGATRFSDLELLEGALLRYKAVPTYMLCMAAKKSYGQTSSKQRGVRAILQYAKLDV